MFGFSEDDFSEEEKMFGVRPCNRRAVQLFIALAAQQRVGMSGTTGLNYGAIAVVMGCHGIRPRERKSILRKIRVMEVEVLAMWVQEHE